jgi:hypothetical protein
MLFVAHISQQNNQPELADAALSGWNDLNACHVIHATQESGFDWFDLDESTAPSEVAVQG